ncbi:MAG: hypothetical protein C0631_02160 [Sedimenticola sp.]|nr:MAG: hypothetical protein C0631_02160 [Sedimenticola sp.]
MRQNTITPFLLAVLLLISAFISQANASDDNDGAHKVVYHADFADPRRFSAMLTSINNMLTHYENEMLDYDIRIVFVAHGIRYVTDDKLTKTPFEEDADLAERRANLKGRLMSLHDVKNVKLELCDITRSQIGLDKAKLYPGVTSVPSGVVRVAELQHEGFAYIKVE